MIVKSLTGFNWGKHKEINFDCDGPLVGVIGVNGSGKSTILTLVEFLITGEARDNLDTYVRNGEGNGGGEMTFQKYGKIGTISRQVGKTKKRSLEWDGKTYTKAAEVDKVMSEIFGADKKALANSVFVNQGTLEEVLFRDGADRKKAFIQLVNLSYCGTRAKQVETEIARLGATVVDLTPAKDEALLARNAAEATLARLDTEIQGYTDLSPLLATIRERNTATVNLQLLLTQIGDLELKRTEKENELDARLNGRTTEDLHTELHSIDQELTTKREAAETYRAIVGELTHYKNLEAEINADRNKLSTLTQELAVLNPQRMDPAARQAILDELNAQLSSHEWFIHFEAKIAETNAASATSVEALAALAPSLMKVNPRGLTNGQLDQETRELELAIQADGWYAHIAAQIDGKNRQYDELTETLAGLTVPEHASDMDSFEEQLKDKQSQLGLLERYEAMQIRISSCLGSACPDSADCPECGLKLANTFQLSNEELYAKSQMLAALREDVTNLETIIKTTREACTAYDRETQRIKTLQNKLTSELTALRKDQAKYAALPNVEESRSVLRVLQTNRQVLTDLQQQQRVLESTIQTYTEQLEQARDEQSRYARLEDPVRTTFVLQKLREQEEAIVRKEFSVGQVNASLRNNISSKQRYPLAIKHWASRNDYTNVELQRQLNEVTELNGRLQTARQAWELLQGTLGQLATLDREIQEKQVKVDEAQATVNAELPPELMVPGKTLTQLEAEMLVLEEQRKACAAQRDMAASNYQTCNTRFQDIVQRMADNQTVIDLLADLRRLRDLLSDDGLPLAYVKHRFDQLTAFTQEGLTKMNANFYVGADAERPLEFTFHRLDESDSVTMPMNKLSGGQRVRLCISFLMALQKCLIKDVGLLVLDEPLVHTDEAGIDQIVQFLSDMRSELKNAEHQIWVVDHNPKIGSALDKKLQLN